MEPGAGEEALDCFSEPFENEQIVLFCTHLGANNARGTRFNGGFSFEVDLTTRTVQVTRLANGLPYMEEMVG